MSEISNSFHKLFSSARLRESQKKLRSHVFQFPSTGGVGGGGAQSELPVYGVCSVCVCIHMHAAIWYDLTPQHALGRGKGAGILKYAHFHSHSLLPLGALSHALKQTPSERGSSAETKLPSGTFMPLTPCSRPQVTSRSAQLTYGMPGLSPYIASSAKATGSTFLTQTLM